MEADASFDDNVSAAKSIIPAITTPYDPSTGETIFAVDQRGCVFIVVTMAVSITCMLLSLVFLVVSAFRGEPNIFPGVLMGYGILFAVVIGAWVPKRARSEPRRCQAEVERLTERTAAGELGPVPSVRGTPCWLTKDGSFAGRTFSPWHEAAAFYLQRVPGGFHAVSVWKPLPKPKASTGWSKVRLVAGYIGEAILVYTGVRAYIHHGMSFGVVATILPCIVHGTSVLASIPFRPIFESAGIKSPRSGRRLGGWYVVHPKASSEEELREMLSHRLVEDREEAAN